MLVDRKKFIEHLSKINCGGLLKDSILSDRFKCTGFSVSQDLLLVTAGMDGADPLAKEVGVVNLEMFLKILSIGEEEKIAFSILEDSPNAKYIVIEYPNRPGDVAKLVTSNPNVIGSRAEPHLVEKVLGLIPADQKWTPLGTHIVRGVQEAIQKLGAEVVVFHASPKGSRVVVGEEKANSISLNFPDLLSKEEYKLTFHSTLIAPVFQQITDYTKAEVLLTGKDSVVPVREGAYMFVMSPAKEV